MLEKLVLHISKYSLNLILQLLKFFFAKKSQYLNKTVSQAHDALSLPRFHRKRKSFTSDKGGQHLQPPLGAYWRTIFLWSLGGRNYLAVVIGVLSPTTRALFTSPATKTL